MHASVGHVDDVAEAVVLASRALMGVAARSLAAVNDEVTLPQHRALVLLSARGPLTVGALAEALAVNPSTVTRLCDRLVRKRLVSRHTAPTSRREVRVTLTPTGRALVDQVMARRRDEIAGILSSMSEEGRRRLAAALSEFAAAAGEGPEEA